jgi:hypothetical protein
MNQDIDSDSQNSLKEEQNLVYFHDDSDKFLSNDNTWPFLDFNSPNNCPINMGNIFTQPTTSFLGNNNICSRHQNNGNEVNNEKKENEEVKEAKKEKKEKKEKKGKGMLGRKKKNSSIKGLHTKYNSDNIIRKIKTLFLNILLNKINSDIKKEYKKKLFKINQYFILRSGNKFLNQTLEDIFSNSNNISSNNKNLYSKLSRNKKIISDLLNEKDEQKRKKFNDLFKLTFLDCLKHFRESEKFKELEGLTTLKNVINKFTDDSEYSILFEHYVNNFEKVINNIKEKRKKKKEIL